MRAVCLGLFAFAFLGTPAFADEERAACMGPVNITPTLVQAASEFEFSGRQGGGAVPSFLVGHLSPTRVHDDDEALSGAVMFVRNADASWRAFMPRSGESVVGVFAAPSGAMIVVTQWQSEGPGQSWMLLRSPDGLQSGVCSEIDFPAALNQPTWANETLALHDLDIDARGRGDIIGIARTDDRGDLWYAYSTRNHGETWSAPRRLSGERAARAGLYTSVLEDESTAPAGLVAELTRYAASHGDQN